MSIYIWTVQIEPLGCYLRQTEQKTERGCVANLKSEDKMECINSSHECKTCNENNCNEKSVFQVCNHCSSDTDGKACISGAQKLNEKQCPNYMDQCYIHLENGVVRRGCTNDLITPVECKFSPENCELCIDRECSKRSLEPQNCVTCDSKMNEICLSVSNLNDTSLYEKCSISIKDKGCFHYINNHTNRHIRGILSTVL